MAFLANLGRALGETVRNFREELSDDRDGRGESPAPSSKPTESVPAQLGTALRKGRDALGLKHVQSEVHSMRSELGELKRTVDRERDGLRGDLSGQPDGGETPGAAEEPPTGPAKASGDRPASE